MEYNEEDAYQMSSTSYNLGESKLKTQDEIDLAKNHITFDYDDLTPQVERIKLEGDEYEAKNKRSRDLAT